MSADHLPGPRRPGLQARPPRGGSLRPVRRRLLAGRQRARRLDADAGARRLPRPLHRSPPWRSTIWNRWFFDSLEASERGGGDAGGLRVPADRRLDGGRRRRHRAHARDPAGALARLDRCPARRALARTAALLSPQRHRQGAAQPRVPHLRRHALGHRAAGRSRHRPGAGARQRRRVHRRAVDRGRLHLLRSGRLGRRDHPRLHDVGGPGLRRRRLPPHAVGRRAAGRLRRPQERGGGLLPLRHDAHPRQRRERRFDERRALRAGDPGPLLRQSGGALDGDRVAARAL